MKLKHLLPAAILAASFFGSAAPTQAISLNAGYTDSLVAVLPGPNPNFYGDIAVDAAGNRYVTGGFSTSVYKVDVGGTVSTFTPAAASTALGLEILGSNLYFSNETNSLALQALTGGPLSVLASVPSGIAPMGITAALDGKMLFLSNYGGLWKYDIALNTFSATSISGQYFPAVTTGLDGKIYVTDYKNSQILKYDPASDTYTVFKTGAAGVGGLTVDPHSGDIFAAFEDTREIWRFSEDGLNSALFASDMPIDGGYYPTGLAFSTTGDHLYYLDWTGGYNFSLRQISGFPITTVPEPETLVLMALGLVVLARSHRRTRGRLPMAPLGPTFLA